MKKLIIALIFVMIIAVYAHAEGTESDNYISVNFLKEYNSTVKFDTSYHYSMYHGTINDIDYSIASSWGDNWIPANIQVGYYKKNKFNFHTGVGLSFLYHHLENFASVHYDFVPTEIKEWFAETCGKDEYTTYTIGTYVGFAENFGSRIFLDYKLKYLLSKHDYNAFFKFDGMIHQLVNELSLNYQLTKDVYVGVGFSERFVIGKGYTMTVHVEEPLARNEVLFKFDQAMKRNFQNEQYFMLHIGYKI